MTALVVAVCFLLALFLHPLFLAIPAVATAPALVIVGIFMMQSTAKLDLADFAKAVPAVLTMILLFSELCLDLVFQCKQVGD